MFSICLFIACMLYLQVNIDVFVCFRYVVCITVETFITICHPTRIKQMCTLFRARAVTVVLLITSLLLYVISPIITKVSVYYFTLFPETCIVFLCHFSKNNLEVLSPSPVYFFQLQAWFWNSVYVSYVCSTNVLNVQYFGRATTSMF